MTSLPSGHCAVGYNMSRYMRRVQVRLLWPLLLSVSCVVVASRPASADMWSGLANRLTLSALLRAEWRVETRDATSQELAWLVEPELVAQLPWDVRFVLIARGYIDAVDKIEPGPLDQPEIAPVTRRLGLGDDSYLALREAYLEATIGRLSVLIGKQQLVWGKADGIKVLDVLNPQDFHEYILEDFDKSRIPLWSMNVELPIRDANLQLVWIFDQTYHDLPPSNATFALTSRFFVPPIPTGLTVDRRDVQRPDRIIQDSDVGVRLSTFWAGWDLSLNYLYHYDDFPVAYRALSLTTSGALATVTPRYKRTHLIGGTFSNAFGNVVVRGEISFSSSRFLSTTAPADLDGVVKTQEIGSVLGLDWAGWSETLMSAQLFLNALTDRPSGVFRQQVESILTLLMRRDFFHDQLIAEIIWLQSFNRGDGLVRPKLQYELSSGLLIWIGADVFYGDREGVFGQFDARDRLTLGLEWGF